MANMPLAVTTNHIGIRTRSCRTPERITCYRELCQNQSRTLKCAHTENIEESSMSDAQLVKRSRSLGPFDLPRKEFESTHSRLRLRDRPSKKERNENNEENIVQNSTVVKRSQSLGPFDLPGNECGSIRPKPKRGRPPKRERNESDEENVVLNAPKMKRSRSLGPFDLPGNECDPIHPKPRRGRPPKRERNESDEENIVSSAPKFKRSRSLGPRDLRRQETFVVERNLRERNVLSDRSSRERVQDSSFSSVTVPVTRSQKNRRLLN